MINIVIADENDIDDVMKIRLEMLREVNGLSQEHDFGEEFEKACKSYFEDGNQTTVLAKTVDGKTIGCASICSIRGLPRHSTWQGVGVANPPFSGGYNPPGD